MKYAIAILVLLCIAAVFALVTTSSGLFPSPASPESGDVSSNPLEDAPEAVNPTANTNPFEDAYPNPFE